MNDFFENDFFQLLQLDATMKSGFLDIHFYTTIRRQVPVYFYVVLSCHPFHVLSLIKKSY